MEAQVAKMKEAFEQAAVEMGGKAEVDVQVMYPGFKFADGDLVVEIAKRQQLKLDVKVSWSKVVEVVTQMSLQDLGFQQ